MKKPKKKKKKREKPTDTCNVSSKKKASEQAKAN